MTNEEAKVFLDNLKVCIDEHPVVADWLVEIADRKTEPTISKMEQVDKDINVRSKDEPMKTADYCDICKRDMCEVCVADATNPYCVPSHYEISYEPKDEPQTDIHDLTDCDFCKEKNCEDCEGSKDEQSGKE